MLSAALENMNCHKCIASDETNIFIAQMAYAAMLAIVIKHK